MQTAPSTRFSRAICRCLLLAASALPACSRPPDPASSHPPDAASALQSYLPAPPAGWKLQREPLHETIAGAGSRAVGFYVPLADNDQAQGIARTEIHLLQIAPNVKKNEALQKLRQHVAANKFTFWSNFKVGDFKGVEGPPEFTVLDWQVVTVFVTDDLIVDTVSAASTDPKDAKAWNDHRAKTTEQLAQSVDYAKLQAYRASLK